MPSRRYASHFGFALVYGSTRCHTIYHTPTCSRCTDADREAIGALAMAITEYARARYVLHQRVRHRLQADLGTPDTSLNQKLTAWWNLDFAALRAEVKKVFKHDIPLADRDDWETFLTTDRAEHARLTSEIIQLETELNARVYALFDLTPEEIAIVEERTRV